MKLSKNPSTALIGFGVVGKAYHKMFPEAIVYDPPLRLYGTKVSEEGMRYGLSDKQQSIAQGQERVNKCEVAIVAVWTGLKENGELDMSVVEETIDWIECPLIIIKSALNPGVTDYLIKKTGKRIAVSTEFIGEGNYYIPSHKYPHQTDPRKHQMLVVGGELDVATQAAEVLWRRMSPDIKIHLVTALEAEINKLIENSWPALKVTFINCLMSLTNATHTNFLRVHQAWQSDPRAESMHVRAVQHDRGWKSKCWSKDVPALANYAKSVGADDMTKLLETILGLNEEHYRLTHDEGPYESN